MKKFFRLLDLLVFLLAASEAIIGRCKQDSITLIMACFMLLGGIYANTIHRK